MISYRTAHKEFSNMNSISYQIRILIGARRPIILFKWLHVIVSSAPKVFLKLIVPMLTEWLVFKYRYRFLHSPLLSGASIYLAR